MKRIIQAAIVTVVVVLAAVGSYFAYGLYNPHTSLQSSMTSNSSSSPTSTSSTSAKSQTSTCSGYPPGGNCIAPYSYDFTASVNYTGSWRLTYNGTNNVGESNAYFFTKNLTGTGYFAVSVTLTGLNDHGLSLCAKAQKLDGSNATLILTVGYSQQTSLPYGSTSVCSTVVP